MHLRLAALSCLAIAAACSPPVCDPISSTPDSVCHRADAGAITAGAPFTLEATSYVRGGACQVVVDGGQIALSISGVSACGGAGGAGAAAPVAPSTVTCTIPALAAGTYVVSPQVTFTIPESTDAGVPPCL